MSSNERDTYTQIIAVYEKIGSVQQTAAALGVSRNTVQRVLLTEGLWESRRSKEVVELVKQGLTAQEIADKLYLSLKCVQNYMPYTQGMYDGNETVNARKSKEKRQRMLTARNRQVNKRLFEEGEPNTGGIMMKKELAEKKRTRFPERMSEFMTKEERPNKAVKKYLPSVFRVKLELVDYFGDPIVWVGNDLEVVKKYAKVQNGFTREVLVQASMSLNALNYMIQKLYGWQNSHLHSFSLPKDTFDAVTDGGKIEAWEKLCGVLFRCPDDENSDAYCGDDYDGTVSFKTWLKNKYTGTEFPFCVSDTYIENQRLVEELEDCRMRLSLMDTRTTSELECRVDLGGAYDTLVERLSLADILCISSEMPEPIHWLAATDDEITEKVQLIEQYKQHKSSYLSLLEGLRELRDRRVNQEELDRIMHRGSHLYGIPKTKAEQLYAENTKEIGYLEKYFRKILSAMEPQITPLTDTLLYNYDYGDGWCVKVTCLEGYYINDSWDHPNEQGYVLLIPDDKEAVLDWDFFACSSDEKIAGEFAELLRNAACKKAPRCLVADGLCLLDDVGGIHGFADMLRVLHGKDAEEADEMREWAKGMGWTGRMSKPENML